MVAAELLGDRCDVAGVVPPAREGCGGGKVDLGALVLRDGQEGGVHDVVPEHVGCLEVEVGGSRLEDVFLGIAHGFGANQRPSEAAAWPPTGPTHVDVGDDGPHFLWRHGEVPSGAEVEEARGHVGILARCVASDGTHARLGTVDVKRLIAGMRGNAFRDRVGRVSL